MKIKDIGEFELIDRITKKPKDKNVFVGIGDDAAVIKSKKGLEVLTTDTLVEGDHFKREWFSSKQIGMKAIEINVSDIGAMGGIPKYVLVSLCLPKDLEVDFVEEMYRGMWKTCDKYNIEIIGGNMTHSNQIVLSITLIGETNIDCLSLRSGAKLGDYIFVSGPIGNGRAGLRSFQENIEDFNQVKKRYLEPKARLDFALKIAPYVNSMIDISDGLAPEVKHICTESKCGAMIYKEKIPINDDVRSIARVLKEDEYNYALFGGEDFELVYTVSKDNIKNVQGYILGEIIKDKVVKLQFRGITKIIKEKGYDHFSNTI
jgi:thiamine-monophosphate kinase